MEFNPSVITEEGQALIAAALAGDINIVFTKIVTGDGTHTPDEDLSKLTELTSPKQEFPLTAKEILNSSTIHLKYIVSNVNPDGTPLTVGYYVKELGLYAKSDQEGAEEILYAVATAVDGSADWLPPYNELQPSNITMDWYTAVGNAASVTLETPNRTYIYDDTTTDKYVIGINNGLLYYEEVNE